MGSYHVAKSVKEGTDFSAAFCRTFYRSEIVVYILVSEIGFETFLNSMISFVFVVSSVVRYPLLMMRVDLVVVHLSQERRYCCGKGIHRVLEWMHFCSKPKMSDLVLKQEMVQQSWAPTCEFLLRVPKSII